jgi:transposase InsO family protein
VADTASWRRATRTRRGARKLAARLERENIAPAAASTVHAIVRRNERVIETAGQGVASARFAVWRLKPVVGVPHSQPYHPQSRGKNERFHRTLNKAVLSLSGLRGLKEAQRAFDAWLPIYHREPPHEAARLRRGKPWDGGAGGSLPAECETDAGTADAAGL